MANERVFAQASDLEIDQNYTPESLGNHSE
jgi:hypothetical protein